MLQREAALRNLLGLAVSEPETLLPTSSPALEKLEPKWEDLVHLAEGNRPDLIELKLIIKADEQSLIIANNQAKPRLDASALYRWNGLEGETPAGARIESRGGQFTETSLAVNFSVPLGLRSARANLRRTDLILARDRANLTQGLHSVSHLLALRMRNLAQFYAQYQQIKVTRAAAAVNLDQQIAEFRSGRTIVINVLQAISDWGNAISSEAQSLAQYNTELANLEQETGTILDTHAVRFVEERFASIGPLGRHAPAKPYPAVVRSNRSEGDRYPSASEQPEEILEREKPDLPGQE